MTLASPLLTPRMLKLLHIGLYQKEEEIKLRCFSEPFKTPTDRNLFFSEYTFGVLCYALAWLIDL